MHKKFYVPVVVIVCLLFVGVGLALAEGGDPKRGGELFAEPIFGKSNLIFTLVRADGLIHIPLNANGASEGEVVEVKLF